MRRPTVNEHRLGRVQGAFESLPGRYLGRRGAAAVCEIRLEDIGETWQLELGRESCIATRSASATPDAVIHSDSGTWLKIRDGRLSGLDAYVGGRLRVEGDLDLAMAFEGMFSLPAGRPPLVRVHEVEAGDERVSTLSAGDGAETVLLLHGLGGTKSSFFRTVSALAPDHTVHALDFPGFGASSKPVTGGYDAPWFAGGVLEFMDALGIDRAHVVGNSMGGRVALELGLDAPDRVSSLSLLAPALAWRRNRPLLPLVRLLRPELAAIPHPMLQRVVRDQLRALFAHPERIDPELIETGTEEFCRGYRSRSARIAFFKAARNIYLDPPFGDEGLWTRLRGLVPPALFIWGDADTLVPAAFERHVDEVLPKTHQVVLAECGHVAMIEQPERTHRLIRERISSSADLGSSLRRWAMRAAS